MNALKKIFKYRFQEENFRKIPEGNVFDNQEESDQFSYIQNLEDQMVSSFSNSETENKKIPKENVVLSYNNKSFREELDDLNQFYVFSNPGSFLIENQLKNVESEEITNPIQQLNNNNLNHKNIKKKKRKFFFTFLK